MELEVRGSEGIIVECQLYILRVIYLYITPVTACLPYFCSVGRSVQSILLISLHTISEVLFWGES